MGVQIAQTAFVDPRAQLGTNVRIGHFCVVGPDAKIGDGTTLEEHVVVSGIVSIGRDNHIFQGAVIGAYPQDTGYKDAPTSVEIGDGNVFREHCTVNRGTEKEEGVTRVGDNNFFMVNTHVGHDCVVGDRIIMANNVMLGGHVRVGNDVTIAAGVGIHQFASVGQLVFIGAMSRVLHDVPPFLIAEGTTARVRAVNAVGLKRHDYSKDDIRVLYQAFKLLYRKQVGVEAAREELFGEGPIRPVLVHLFNSLERTHETANGRGQDRRGEKKAA